MQNQVPFQVVFWSIDLHYFLGARTFNIISEPTILDITSTVYSSTDTDCTVIGVTLTSASSRLCLWTPKKIWATAYTLLLWDNTISKILSPLFAFLVLNIKQVF